MRVSMQVDDFDFDLPESLIALRPAQPRDTARLLHIPAGQSPTDRRVSDLPDLLRAGDAPHQGLHRKTIGA